MDFPSEFIYEALKDNIWTELGPLNPDWFDVLTAQASTYEGNASDQDDLCANQEGHFKPPLNKTALESQMFSTPKVFRHRHVLSPQTEEELSFTTPDKGTPWTSRSPHMFQTSKEEVLPSKYECMKKGLDILHTPQKSHASYANHISESLGVNIHSDLSWTSSLNTPPGLPSTLILSKKDDSPRPMSLLDDKNIVFVRELFPSVAAASKNEPMSPKRNDPVLIQQDVVSPENKKNPESLSPLPSSLNHCNTGGRQKVPDAIEDGQIRSTVESVLEGAENGPSLFFSNSSSALRKVKTTILRRKKIISTNACGFSSPGPPTENMNASTGKTTGDRELCSIPPSLHSESPARAKELGFTQWSPLSLSEISTCAVDSSCLKKSGPVVENKSLTEAQSHSLSVVASPKKPDSGFTKKKRAFVYTVEPTNPQEQKNSLKMELSQGEDLKSKAVLKAEEEVECFNSNSKLVDGNSSVQQNDPAVAAKRDLPPFTHSRSQDYDVTLLCWAFAQDSSQMINSGKLSTAVKDSPQDNFSPSACLAAMKQAKHIAKQASLPHDSAGISNRRPVSDTYQNDSGIEGTVRDSGFQSAVADITNVTATPAHLSPEKPAPSQPWITPIYSSHRENREAQLEDVLPGGQTDASMRSIEEEDTVVGGGEHELHVNNSLQQGQLNGCSEKTSDSLPYDHASGFKTPLDKATGMLSFNQEKGKCFPEQTVGDRPLTHQPSERTSGTKDAGIITHVLASDSDPASNGPSSRDSQCQLTVSQRADVKALCTLLEEADTQFEFTQFQTADQHRQCQSNAIPSQKANKEFDPDLLSGIDFDDSFSSAAEKQNEHERILSVDENTHIKSPKDRTKLVEPKGGSSSEQISKEAGHKTAAEPCPLFLGLKEKLVMDQILEMEQSDKNVAGEDQDCVGGHSTGNIGHKEAILMFGDFSPSGFSDSREKIPGPRDEHVPGCLQNGSVDPTTNQSGFKMASGKGISISAKAMKQATALLKDCDVVDCSDATPVQQRNSGLSENQKNHPRLKSTYSVKATVVEETVNSCSKFQRVQHVEGIYPPRKTAASSDLVGFHGKRSLNESPFPSPLCRLSKNTSSPSSDSCNSGGFRTAGGSKISVSAVAIAKADRIFKELYTPEEANKQMQRESSSRLGDCEHPSSGFQTASGKVVTVTSAALNRANILFRDCNREQDDSVANQIPKVPGHKSPARNTGFLMASKKPVALSAEALRKARALFDDIVTVSSPVWSSERQDNVQNADETNTAGGATVCESKTSLRKAKNLPKDRRAVSEKPVETDGELVTKEKSGKVDLKFHTTHGGKIRTSENSAFESMNAKASSVCLHADPFLAPKSLSPPSSSVANAFCSSAADELKLDNERESLSDSEITEAALLISENTEIKKKTDETPQNIGFRTAGGKKVSVSDDSLAKAKSLLNESVKCEEPKKRLSQNRDCLMRENVGFCTASGKGVWISSAALKKAHSLLGECDDTGDEITEKMAHCDNMENHKDISKNESGLSNLATVHVKPSGLVEPIPSSSSTVSKKIPLSSVKPISVDGGFFTASGKKVKLPDDAVARAKSLLNQSLTLDNMKGEPNQNGGASPPQDFGYCEAGHKTPSLPDDAAAQTEQSLCAAFEEAEKTLQQRGENLPRRNVGFQTAGGRGVAISAEALQKAQMLFGDCGDNEGKISTKAAHSNPVHTPPARSNGFLKASGKQVAFSPKALLKAKALFADISVSAEISPVSTTRSDKKPEESPSHDPKAGTSKAGDVERARLCEGNTSQEQPSRGEVSIVNIHSLDLSGCTETQQWSLAQEALDCTKALLEDESAAGLLTTPEAAGRQDTPKCSGAFSVAQNPAEKRPAEDADMPDEPPMKRRLLEEFDRTLDNLRRSKLRPETSSPNGILKDRRVFQYSVSLQPNITRPSNDAPRTPSAFIPPIRKQRTSLQESSKLHKEGGHQRPAGMSSKGHTFIPPTKKNPTATRSMGNRDAQEKTSAESTNCSLGNKQNNTVNCGAAESALEDGTGPNTCRQEAIQTPEDTELARNMQDMRIRKKNRQTIQPLPGSLFLTKTSGVSRIPFKDAVNGKTPAKYTEKQLYEFGVHRHVGEITGENAESFRFDLQQFLKKEAFTDGGVRLADGGCLIPSDDGTAGKEQFYRALCDTPGVDPKLISEEWGYNHYRWIVWKQASMERSFPETMGSLCLTPEQVLLQLKYRYDVEIDRSQRPALRRIMEKDDVPAKTLVLCVCGVVSRGHSPLRRQQSDAKTPQGSAVVWLTDGWYAIKGQLDDPLTAMLHGGRLAVGGKLIIHGAQLVGSQEACSPLEAPDSLMLKICANSSRRARWDAKLGFHRDPRPFLLPLSCLYSNGGPVGCMDFVVLRSYPMQWMERKPDGGGIFRTVRAEEKESRRYNSHRQKAMEDLFVKIQAEIEKEEKDLKIPQRRKRLISRQDIASLQDGEELYKIVGDDPAYIEANLNEQQLESLRKYSRALMEKKQVELQDRYRRALEDADGSEASYPRRDVTPVWRLSIADSLDPTGNIYQLNIWRPTSDLQSMLKEGCRYKGYNLTASDGKKRIGLATVQLSSTKKTRFENLQPSQDWLSACFQPRVSTSFMDLQNSALKMPCGEVDVTGYVINIVDPQGSSPAFYLVDGRLNFVKVRCFSSLAQSGLEDVVKPCTPLAVSNLQLRGQSTHPTPVVYAGDLAVFSTNPKEKHLQESLSLLRALGQGQENFFITAEEKLSRLIKCDGPSSLFSPAPTTERLDLKRTSLQGTFTPLNSKPPPATGSSEKDPKTLKRRRALDYLSRIPSPPPLPHLSSGASPCISKTFNPPRRSRTPGTPKPPQSPAPGPATSALMDEWVNDEELAMIDTQVLRADDARQVYKQRTTMGRY